MKIISLEQCCRVDFHFRFLESIIMPQKVENIPFSSFNNPKRQCMLLLISGCQTRYFTKSGKVLTTKDGDVVYVPKGSEYRVECIADSDKSCTYQINFLLFDTVFQPFIFSDEVTVFSFDMPIFRTLFEKSYMLAQNEPYSNAMQKSILFEIFGTLASHNTFLKSNPIIAKGIEYLLAHYHENPSITKLAEICHVSNEYFRKLFKQQTGQSPTEYKNALRIKKAELYLICSDLTVAQIAEQLSFTTVSHFIKSFKASRGCSPLTFRNSKR